MTSCSKSIAGWQKSEKTRRVGLAGLATPPRRTGSTCYPAWLDPPSSRIDLGSWRNLRMHSGRIGRVRSSAICTMR